MLVAALDRHEVDYLVVGGVGANAYGAQRTTEDMDCLVRRERANLDRLALAMKDVGARLRAAGLSDEDAKALPLPLDGRMLEGWELSTWTTDAGWFDVLTNIPARDGHRLTYEDLEQRSHVVQGDGFSIKAADLADIIASKEWADRPKDHEALPELLGIARGSAPTLVNLVDQAHPSLSAGVATPRVEYRGQDGSAPGPGLRGAQAETEYVGYVWKDDQPRIELKIQAKSLQDAEREVLAQYGEGFAVSICNEDDARRPR